MPGRNNSRRWGLAAAFSVRSERTARFSTPAWSTAMFMCACPAATRKPPAGAGSRLILPRSQRTADMRTRPALRAQGGAISGMVRAQGKEGAAQETAGGGYESRKFKFAERVNYAELHDFVVYIDQPSTEKLTPPAQPVQVLTTRRVSQK